MNDEFYISIVAEIFDGYTEVDFYGNLVYLKHFSIRDQKSIQNYYEKYLNEAVSRGVEKEEEILKRLKEDETWLESDDIKIISLQEEIKNLKITKKNLILPSQQNSIQKDIDTKEKELLSLQASRRELIGKTAEDYASSRSTQDILRSFVYRDKNLNELFFTESEFDELEDYQLIGLNKFQNRISENFSETNLQHAVLRPFFSMYLSQCENLFGFFGKPIIDLSVYQLKLAMYGRMFFSIFQYTDDIPENIKEDPEKLISFSESQRNKGKAKTKIRDDADASMVFGAKKEDIDYLAGESNKKPTSLSEELKKHGGKLNMEQMMKLAGH